MPYTSPTGCTSATRVPNLRRLSVRLVCRPLQATDAKLVRIQLPLQIENDLGRDFLLLLALRFLAAHLGATSRLDFSAALLIWSTSCTRKRQTPPASSRHID